MKLKKTLAALLTVSLLSTGLVLPAAASEATDARLTAVTQKVKETLSLDTGAYDNFQGSLRENVLAPTWSLQWTGEDGSLSITATESGKILSYSLDGDRTAPYSGSGFSPTFPEGSEEAALTAAQAFADLVLEPGVETTLLSAREGNKTLGATSYRFTSDVLLYGFHSPLSLSVTVRAGDNVVTSFRRDSLEDRYVNGVTKPDPKYDTSYAMEQFKSILALELQYVLDEDSSTAVLRYLPVYGDNYYVDAQTGKLINLTELYAKMNFDGGFSAGGGSLRNEAAADMGAISATKPELTKAELAGVAELENVRTKEALDEALQKEFPQLGLSKYTLAQASYHLKQGESEDQITCVLTYGRSTSDGVFRRTVTVDAETGALISVHSSAPWSEDGKYSVSYSRAKKAAEDFLSAHYKADFEKTALFESSEKEESRYLTDHSFTYAQIESGYFLPSNRYDVAVDLADGSISGFSAEFDPDVTFESAENLLTMEQAIDLFWKAHSPAPIGYLAVPASIDLAAPDIRPLLADAGYQYIYTLQLGFTLEPRFDLSGIDAKTGELILTQPQTEPSYAYTDLEGHWAREMFDKLAQYGVGWLGDKARPDETMTQLELVALLVSTDGYRYDPSEKNAADTLYSLAYGMGILSKDQRSDSQTLTRAQLTKMILDGGGYGKIASLTGIFRCSFADEASIPTEYYGYAALAQGLGLAKGDGAGNFAAGRTATRAEGVAMLYQLMSR